MPAAHERAKSVLVTGSSSGIGWACALELDRQGWKVFAAVRKQTDADKLKEASSVRITPVIIDLCDYQSIHQAALWLEQYLGDKGLDALVNNAGVTVQGPMEIIPMDMFEWQLKVNLLGQVAMTQKFLPLIRKARGRIIYMSSESGRMTLPLVGPYSASKFAMEAAANAFRIELLPQGIKVILIEPASIKTPIWSKTSDITNRILDAAPQGLKDLYTDEIRVTIHTPGLLDKIAIPVNSVVQALMRALTAKRPKPRYIVGLEAWALIMSYRFLPTFLWDSINSMGVKMLARIF
jgi:NAD(P)-dependent dehydrogenase (short-subunit alcohol dehydrogenase family)